MNAVSAAAHSGRSEVRTRWLDVLVAPRYTGSCAKRWWLAGFFGLLTVGAVVAGIAIPDARRVQLALLIYAFGASLLTMWLATLLLLARDGRRLRLPGVVRNNVHAMWVYVLTLVAAPVVVVAATGGDIAPAILFPALAIAASLAYMLLPLLVGSCFGFIPAIYIGLHNSFHMPSPFDPRFQHWAWLVLALLVLVDVIRWQQILRSDGDDDSTWRRTMLSQMRGNMFGKWASIDQRWAWRRSGHKKTAVDFRDIAPAKPAKAIEVALGGWYVPQTMASRLDALARVMIPLLLFAPLMWFMNIGHEHSLHKAWKIIGISGGLWIGLFGGAMLALMTVAMIRRRWSHAAEMALLALLPGIDDGRLPRHAARAVFTKPAITFVVLWLCMLIPPLAMHNGPMALLLATLVMTGMAMLMAMAVLKLMAGRPIRTFGAVVLSVVVLVLINVGAVLTVTTPVAKLGAWAPRLQMLVVLLWVFLIAWAVWRSIKAWRTLLGRAHPFMANSP